MAAGARRTTDSRHHHRAGRRGGTAMKKILLLAALAIPVFGQSPLQVSVSVAGGASSSVAAAGSVAITASDLGQLIPAVVTVRYTGSATNASITGISVSGTNEITLVASPVIPAALAPGGSTPFTLQYNPSSGNAIAAQITIAFTENGQASTFAFTVTGTSPRITFSYFVSPSGAVTNLNAGDPISYPATNLGSSSTAVISVLNRGTATGSVRSVSLSGSGFQLTASPAPVDLAPGQVTAFNVVFTPVTTGGALGVL